MFLWNDILYLCSISFLLGAMVYYFISTFLLQIYGIKFLQSKRLYAYVPCVLCLVHKIVYEYIYIYIILLSADMKLFVVYFHMYCILKLNTRLAQWRADCHKIHQFWNQCNESTGHNGNWVICLNVITDDLCTRVAVFNGLWHSETHCVELWMKEIITHIKQIFETNSKQLDCDETQTQCVVPHMEYIYTYFRLISQSMLLNDKSEKPGRTDRRKGWHISQRYDTTDFQTGVWNTWVSGLKCIY